MKISNLKITGLALITAAFSSCSYVNYQLKYKEHKETFGTVDEPKFLIQNPDETYDGFCYVKHLKETIRINQIIENNHDEIIVINNKYTGFKNEFNKIKNTSFATSHDSIKAYMQFAEKIEPILEKLEKLDIERIKESDIPFISEKLIEDTTRIVNYDSIITDTKNLVLKITGKEFPESTSIELLEYKEKRKYNGMHFILRNEIRLEKNTYMEFINTIVHETGHLMTQNAETQIRKLIFTNKIARETIVIEEACSYLFCKSHINRMENKELQKEFFIFEAKDMDTYLASYFCDNLFRKRKRKTHTHNRGMVLADATTYYFNSADKAFNYLSQIKYKNIYPEIMELTEIYKEHIIGEQYYSEDEISTSDVVIKYHLLQLDAKIEGGKIRNRRLYNNAIDQGKIIEKSYNNAIELEKTIENLKEN